MRIFQLERCGENGAGTFIKEPITAEEEHEVPLCILCGEKKALSYWVAARATPATREAVY